MNSSSFAEGLWINYKSFTGRIRFISEKYITVCIREQEHKKNDVCILVYREDWDKIKLTKESEK